ncbi:MAG TPA: CDP-diacylglycerol diphosphatase [Roseiarcus sp.]|jgi:CDP-diacylglycerol pyrophosphatase
MTLRNLTAVLAAAVGAGGVLAGFVTRDALWLTIQVCVVDATLTGTPFPCVLVNTTPGKGRGYAVLRAPFGAPDMILTPTRRVIGVEDPWLQSPDAPNYFDAAWRARRFLSGPGGKTLDGHFALAVNPAHLRSQDQFHIHLGCLAPAVRRWLPRLAGNLPIGTWTRLDAVMTGSSFWALRTGRGDLGGIEPLRLAAQGLADKTQIMSRLTLLVAQVGAEDDYELVILVSTANVSGSLGQISAENLLDLACADGSELPGRI